jgi:hypothetical protein
MAENAYSGPTSGAAFWTGNRLTRKFPEGAPIFAVEVRSPEDYGSAADRRLADKRADYFAPAPRRSGTSTWKGALFASTVPRMRSQWFSAAAKRRMPSPRSLAGRCR